MHICTPIKEDSQATVLRRLKQLRGKVDLAEVWLDQIGDLDLKTLIKKSPLPLLCLVKRSEDGGKFKGSDAEMATILTDAIQFGAKYIDIPFSMPKSLNKKIVQNSRKLLCKTIISHHDFKTTPNLPTLLKMAHKMRESGADIIKIATFAKSLDDCFTMITLAQQLQAEKIPHILIAMGPQGRLSRILTPHLGGTMMFAPLSNRGQTALGQLTVRQLKNAWSLIKK